MTNFELKNLCQKYENENFFKNQDGMAKDPLFFAHQFSNPCDKEIFALISASMAFGRRQQIISSIEKIKTEISKKNLTPKKWIKTGAFFDFFPNNKSGFFHRTFSFKNFCDFFKTLKSILCDFNTLGEYFCEEFQKAKKNSPQKIPKSLLLIQTILKSFDCAPLIPKNTLSACKRVCLFVRWVVRPGPVDLGLWDWFSPADLIIPLDIHVLNSAKSQRILSGKDNASMKSALKITQTAKKIFPDDPCKIDFAFFGMDLEKSHSPTLL